MSVGKRRQHNIIGIDLGTTFSGLSVLNEIGKPEIVPNSDGDRITPSIVFFDPDDDSQVLVGGEARKEMGQNDEHVIVEVKQKMGTQEVFKVGSHSFTPPEISALILKKIIQDAERTRGPIDEAVVTVPANFLETDRRATKDAGKMAGLDKVTIVEEPVAAALLYATTQSVKGCALIFDLGGGTFDVTIANIDGTKVNVVNSIGDRYLGGKDFDRKLAELLNSKYREKSGQALFDDKADYKLMEDAEDLKKTLSRKGEQGGNRPGKKNIMGPAGPHLLEVTPSEFEEAISGYIGKIDGLIDAVLDDAGIDESFIDHVLLVGGSTRIPCIKKMLRDRFGREPEDCVNVDEAVALGAAIYAGLMEAKDGGSRLTPNQLRALNQIHIVNAAIANYGTIAIGEDGKPYNSIIIYKNEPIPCSKTKLYHTVSRGQVGVDCSITQCTFEDEEPEFLWRLSEEAMTGLPSNRPAGQEFSVTFSYNEEGMMHCQFRDVATGRTKEVEVDPGKGESNYKPSVDPDCDVSDFLVD